MPKYTQPRKTWAYSKDFKVKAVKLSNQEGILVKQVAEGLDIHPLMLSRWRKEYRDGKLHGDGQKRVIVKKTKTVVKKDKPTEKKVTAKEIKKLAKLEKENERLKRENDLLKKWQRYLSEIHQNDLDSSRDTDT